MMTADSLDDDPDRNRAISILRTELKPLSADAPELFSELTLLLTKKNFRENKELAKYGNAEMSRKMLVGVVRQLVHGNPKLRDLVNTRSLHLSTFLSLLRARRESVANQQRVNHPHPPKSNGVQKPCAIPQKRPSLVSDSKRESKQPRVNPPPRSNVQKLRAIRPRIPTPVSVSKTDAPQRSSNTPLGSAVQKLRPIRETIPSSQQQRACSKGVCANVQPEIPPSAAIMDEASVSSGMSRISADQLPQTTATRSPTDLQAHYFNSSPITCKTDSNVAVFTKEKAARRENNQAAEPHTTNTVVKFSDPSPLPNPPASEKHVGSNGLSHPPVAPNPAPVAAQTTNPPPMCCSVDSSVDSPIAQAAAPNLKSCSENWKIVACNPIPSTLGPSLGVPKGCEGDPRPSQRLEASNLRSHVAAKGDNSDLVDKKDSLCWSTEAILVKDTSTPEKSVTSRKRPMIVALRSGAQDEATNFTQSCKRLQTTETSDTYRVASTRPGVPRNASSSEMVVLPSNDLAVPTTNIQSSSRPVQELSHSAAITRPGVLGSGQGTSMVAISRLNLSSCTPGHIPHANTSRTVKSDYINSRSDVPEVKEKCKLVAIDEPSECHSLRLLDSSPVKVLRLMYSHSGDALWTLASNGVNKLWQWKTFDKNSTGKADVRQQPELKAPANDRVLANELSAAATNEALHWFALTRNDAYLMSLSGGPISLYNTMSRKLIATFKIFMGAPYTATCFVFLPNNNIIVVGMEDSTIIVYEIRSDQVRFNLTGHNRRITSLALSPTLNLLVSSGEDAQICTWNLSEIEKPQENRILKRMPLERVSTPVMKKVQFHPDGMHFLAVSKTQLILFEASKLKLLHQLTFIGNAITDAIYSCDGQSIYCSLDDGTVKVVSRMLQVKCWINQKAYLHQQISSSVIPHAIAAHPKIPNQFAVGLSDGGVYVLEPIESIGHWGERFRPQDVSWRRCYAP